ncbi:nucleoside-triphosphatase ntp-1 [Paracoccidioides lutzii Pb01]|uniref:Nucleoside-triphosphatase ntp-1 n=1 Tax=Paracoccidioides lutzii (strain ATCC MYA-826 / Pb01) TaxID=502779 RepID=C1GVQ1_PARBA|nr:nucleoside-triphosphatase ntp-1 [Paracoccidioides lutzii Pb01]EEH40273.2 nucleoside-triphosphatase ntp-1 [Paracoccidioides lutzii Pb01]
MLTWRYAVVLDAGSSGTRSYVYRWPDSVKARKSASAKDLASLPEIITSEKYTKKIHPGIQQSVHGANPSTISGISTFAQNPQDVGLEHLRPLLHHVQEVIPEEDVPDTPIFLLATAGMRLLPKAQQKSILNNVCTYIRQTTDFLIPDCNQHVQVIEGVTEGLYGWIATNYLMGGFDDSRSHNHGKGHHTYGFLDMGGASAQIAFAPNATEAQKHANDLTLLRLRSVNGRALEYKVFVMSWLGFGAQEARSRYVKALLESSVDEMNKGRPDPCLHAGLRMSADGTILPPEGPVSGVEPYLVGTGKFDQCLLQTFPLLEKDAPCPDEPCLLHGVHVPAIDFDVNHFIGVSEYWHTTHGIFDMGDKDDPYNFYDYLQRAKDFCSQPWDEIEAGVRGQRWGGKVSKKTANEICFKASWLINILHDGIGIPRSSIGEAEVTTGHNNRTQDVVVSGKPDGYLDAFQAVNKIGATEVSWTLGKAVLYASSQVPPLKNGLPVGFGSNVPGGVPDDFQHTGPQLQPLPPTSQPTLPTNDTITGTNRQHWHDTLFDGHSPRRIPGLFLFLAIVAIAIFFLYGRERRNRVYRRFLGRPISRHSSSFHYRRRSKGLFNSKLSSFFFFSPSPRRSSYIPYERTLEDGMREFELGPGSSSSDDEASATYDEDGSSSVNLLARSKSSTSTSNNISSVGGGGGGGGNRASVGLGLSLDGNGSLLSSHNVGIMDRNGLAVRTESRDRQAHLALAPTTNGRRSRATSPVRKSVV